MARFGYHLGLGGSVALLVWTCVAYLDRPFAEAFSRHLYGSPLQKAFSALLSPLRFLFVLALLCLLLGGGLRACRGGVPAWAGTPLLVSLSLLISLVLVRALKAVFGRSALDPWYVQHGIYTFRWFDPGWAYDSFPSGTLTAASALLYSLWRQHRRLGLPCLASLLLVSACILATGSHWLSDAIAGIYLGFVTGVLARWLVSSGVGPRD